MIQEESKCNQCPRNCNVDRKKAKGYCQMSNIPVIAKASLHHWEEPCISGSRGSGTVFFTGCNLKCVYCQNFKISQENFGAETSIERLGEIFNSLQSMGAHNINLVNPSHYVKQIREAVINAKEIKIPYVYNSNGYEGKDCLKSLDGLIQVYLPDIKYFSSEISGRYSGAKDYFKYASDNVLEMFRQVGSPELNEEGIIKKGLIIRNLILPGQASESIKILDWIAANLPKDVYVSLMSQYTPYYKAGLFPEIDRRITRREYEKVVNHLFKLGFENGYVQERDSAEEQYIPDFNLEGVL